MAHILIVDDMKVNLKVLEVLLDHNGYSTTSALGGEAALEALRNTAADLIISDILMPGMDGFEFCRRCRADERLHHIPFIFYSATHTDTPARRRARELGAHALLTKPADPATLLTTVAAALKSDRDGLRLSWLASEKTKEKTKEKTTPSDFYDSQDGQETAPEESLPAGVACALWRMDETGAICHISPAVETITGFSVEAVKGMGKPGWLARIDPAHLHRVKKAYKALFKNQVPLDTAYPFECRDGRFIQILEKSGLPYSCEGRNLVEGICMDVTCVRDLDAHHFSETENHLIQTFSAGICGNFKALLSGIAGYIELAATPNMAEKDRKHFLDNALTIVRRALEWSDDVAGLDSSVPPVEKETYLEKVVAGAARHVLGHRNPSWSLDIPSDLWECRVSSRMFAAFDSIFRNAREALTKEGVVEIALQNVSLDAPVHLPPGSIVPPGDYVKITIRDNGRGIAPEHLQRIFHPYFTTKSRKTSAWQPGWGLAAARATIIGHGGATGVIAYLNKGTCVQVYLPAQSRTPASDG